MSNPIYKVIISTTAEDLEIETQEFLASDPNNNWQIVDTQGSPEFGFTRTLVLV